MYMNTVYTFTYVHVCLLLSRLNVACNFKLYQCVLFK